LIDSEKDHPIVAELVGLIGEEGLIRLAEEYAGLRLYIPSDINRSELLDRVGIEIASKLARRYGPDRIKVPLMRDWRARHYRSAGLSNAQIARKLGVTETAVEKIFQRSPVKYRMKKTDDRQIDMFPIE